VSSVGYGDCMTVAINQKNAFHPFLELPSDLINHCLFTASEPSVFQTCKSLNAYQEEIYDQAKRLYSKQPLIRQLFPEFFEHDAVLVIPCISYIFQNTMRRMYVSNFLGGISPLATFQSAQVVEDWSALILFDSLLDYIPSGEGFFLKDIGQFNKVIRYSKSKIKIQNCIRKKAAKVDLWMKQNTHLFKGLRDLFVRYEMPIIPKQIVHLSNLRELDFAGCRITYLLNEIGSLIHLRKVDLSNNLLSGLPLSFRFLNDLQEVYLQGNRFENFPTELCYLKKMKTLNLSNNQLSTVSGQLSMMRQLRYLDLSRNAFEFFPKKITQLPELSFLKIGNNSLESIPPCIALCKRLTYVDLTRNPLSSFPDEICLELINFHSLRFINLSRDQYNLLNPHLITHLQARGVLPVLHDFRRSPKMYDLNSTTGIFYSVQQQLFPS
jgi:Leucine-rich repeat (LRR) protein